MNFRQFFSTQAWWGKSIGAFFGFLMAGPIGALFGILIGNFFDQGLNQHFNKPCWSYRVEADPKIQAIFKEGLFSILGYLAKIDGYVSTEAIQMAQKCMNDLGLSSKEKHDAKKYFTQGKSPTFNLNQTLHKIYHSMKSKPYLLQLFVHITYKNAQVNGLSTKKLHAMNTILRALHFAAIHEQKPFEDYFSEFAQEQFRSQQSYSRQQSSYSTPNRSNIEYAFMVLQVPITANKNEVKKAYRKLMSKHHPDKLIAKGANEATIKEANSMAQKISKAYEEIIKYKGW